MAAETAEPDFAQARIEAGSQPWKARFMAISFWFIRDAEAVGDDEYRLSRDVYAKPKFGEGERAMRLESEAKVAPKPR